VRFLGRSDADESDCQITEVRILINRVLDDLLDVIQSAIQARLERHIVDANDLADYPFDV
jgi:hypothetical protein